MKVNKSINLEQLDAELNGKGLNATIDENDNIVEVTLADQNDATQAQLQTAIDAHVALNYKAQAIAAKAAAQAKLAALGLTTDDLEALGL